MHPQLSMVPRQQTVLSLLPRNVVSLENRRLQLTGTQVITSRMLFQKWPMLQLMPLYRTKLLIMLLRVKDVTRYIQLRIYSSLETDPIHGDTPIPTGLKQFSNHGQRRITKTYLFPGELKK